MDETRKSRGIIFSAPSVPKLKDGSKTQSRRLMRVPVDAEGPFEAAMAPGSGSCFNQWGMKWGGKIHRVRCPYGARGSRLWVKESLRGGRQTALRYDSDGSFVVCTDADGLVPEWSKHWSKNWSRDFGQKISPLFMPRWASRITLEITEVRVQRLQDISEEDAKAEGALICNGDAELGALIGDGPSHREGFAQLWRSINSKRAPWESSPWVWAISFRRIPQETNP